MAFSQTMQKAQIPIGCQLCDSGASIQWKCVNCSLLLCHKCKEIHQKIKNATSHKIVDIKEVIPESAKNFDFCEVNCIEHSSQTCVFYCKTCEQFICTKCITKIHKGHDAVDEEEYNDELKKLLEMQRETEIKLSKLALSRDVPGKIRPWKFGSETSKVSQEQTKPTIIITREVTTDLNRILVVVSYSQDSLIISDCVASKTLHVKLTTDKMHVLSKFDFFMYDMAAISNMNFLLSGGETKLKLLDVRTGKISYSNYNVKPLLTICIHVTKNQKVIIGAIEVNEEVDSIYVSYRRLVKIMDEDGNNLKQYEHDSNNKPLFTLPFRVTSTSNGNICVVDGLDPSYNGRVVVLGEAGNIIQIYNGHPVQNSLERPFRPTGILTTPDDTIIVADSSCQLLHIMNCDGIIITCIRTDEVGITLPFSLALSVPGHFYIGCSTPVRSPDHVKSKLYEVKYSGF